MDDFVVDSQLTTAIVDDQNANAATTIGEGVVESGPEAILIDDRQALLDITRLGHGDNAAVITHVEDTICLEDGTKHVLDDDGWRRVRDKAGLLVKLLGEEVHSEIAMLTSLGRGGDTDDLARTTLQDQEVTDTDMVAWDRDGVARVMAAAAFDVANSLALAIANACGTTLTVFTLDDHFFTLMLVTRMQRVEDTVSGMLQATAERVVVAFIIVVAHSVLVFLVGSCTFVFDVVCGLASLLAIIALCHVNVSLAAVDFDFDFGVSVVAAGIAVAGSMTSSQYNAMDVWTSWGSSPFTFEFYVINTISWAMLTVSIVFFVDLRMSWTVFTLFSFLVDVDFFFAAAAGKGSREGRVAFLATFTSGPSTSVSFNLHSSGLFFSDSFVPVRGRENAERNLYGGTYQHRSSSSCQQLRAHRNSRVEVQFSDLGQRLRSTASQLVLKTNRKEDKRRPLLRVERKTGESMFLIGSYAGVERFDNCPRFVGNGKAFCLVEERQETRRAGNRKGLAKTNESAPSIAKPWATAWHKSV